MRKITHGEKMVVGVMAIVVGVAVVNPKGTALFFGERLLGMLADKANQKS